MKIALSTTLFAAALASQASAADVIHYWDFAAATDVVGAVPTSAVGTPDMSVDATWGEAYLGAGNSLNTRYNVKSHLLADIHDGVGATAMAFGAAQDFSFSYWTYNDTSDGSTKGPRIMDCLSGTTNGIQLGTNASNTYNLRLDDDGGKSFITNNSVAPYTSLVLPTDTWVHVAVNVSRTAGTLEVFVDGVGLGAVSHGLTSGISPSMDMELGVINSSGTQNQHEEAGLDDLAFYDGLLSAGDVTGLAAGTLTPLDFLPCPSGASVETVRMGTPANPFALMPGATSGPVIGATWDPYIDHTSFVPGSLTDLLAVGFGGPIDLPLPGMGTLLCNPGGAAPMFFTSSPGVAFNLPMPTDCSFVGIALCTQGISVDASGVSLTNALDITIGSF